MLSEANREELWRFALTDAGIPVGQALLFFGDPESGQGMAWPRGELLHPDEWLSEHDAKRANRRRQAYRVSLRSTLSNAGFAAVARHELEHHRQYDEWGADTLQLLHERALASMAKANGLVGGGRLYNRIPMEMDANAAGARFLRRLASARELHRLALDDASLQYFLEWNTPEPGTLIERMEHFVDAIGPVLAEEFVRTSQGTQP